MPDESPHALQSELLETIDENLQLDPTYFLQLFTSAIIASLGLLLSNTAVVIGAMLISPLHWAMYAFAISIITSRRHLASKAALNFAVSIGTTLIIAILITGIFPLPNVTPEIQLRTQPTLLDLGIALASSVIGAASLYFPRISKSITGVAIAIALMPALAVVGIGLQLGNWTVMQGSALLFLTNVMAIVFGGVVTLYLLNFRPRYEKEKQRFRIGLFTAAGVLIIISIPLGFYLYNSIRQSQLATSLESSFRTATVEQLQNAEVDELSTNFEKDEIVVESTIFLPESSTVTQQQREKILNALSEHTERPIRLKLHLTPTLALRSRSDLEYQQLEQTVSSLVETIIGSDNVTSIAITPASEDEVLQIDIRLTQTADQVLQQDLYSELQTELSKTLEGNFSLELQLVPISRYTEETQIRRAESQITRAIRSLYPNSRVESVNINRQSTPIAIEVAASLPEDEEFDEQNRTALNAAIRAALGLEEKPDVSWYITRFSIY